MSDHTQLFSAKDIDILSQGVAMLPDLEVACFVTKLAQHQAFPIVSFDSIVSLLARQDLPASIAAHRAELTKHFPKEFFPITDARDFLGKILGALSWTKTVLGHEQFLARPDQLSPAPYNKVGLAPLRVPFTLTRPGEWVQLEEAWIGGADIYRHLEVPDGVHVTFRHNFMWPPWLWEVGLDGPSSNSIYAPAGWNKFQVRLDSPAFPTTVTWILL